MKKRKKKPISNKAPKPLTQKKIRSLARTAKKKAWKKVADEVRARDGNVCVVCGQPHDKLNVHHLATRCIKKYWLEPLNLVSVCPKHHLYSTTRSFHTNPMWGAWWLQQNRPEQYKWVMERMVEIDKME